MSKQYQQMIDILRGQRNLLLVGHENPDCDCLGSVLALYLAFGGAEKNWRMLLNDEVPHNLRFLPQLEKMSAPDEVDFSAFEAILLVDCGRLRRCGEWLPPLAAGKKLYFIDHHLGNNTQGDYCVVERDAAAAGEIVAAMIEEAGIAPDDDTALCLYSAIAADTGCFRYLNTTPRALAVASRLLPQVDLELVRIRLFEDRTFANIKMITACFNNLQVECGGLLCHACLPYEEMVKYQAGQADCHDIVNFTLFLTGVKIGILFEEYADYVQISFRCRSGFRVDELARCFGGGGHLLAAGCKTAGRLAEVMPRVLAAARSLL